MKRSWFWLSAFLILIQASCRSEAPATPIPAATIAAAPIQAEAVSHITLLRSGAALEGEYLQLAGQYEPLPLLVCNSDPHISPASWKLVSGELEVLASGFDSQLRSLANPNQPLVVEGHWQRWQGPVGCGRRVPDQEIWYLAVTRIVSPNPLVASSQEMVDLPAGDEDSIQATATAISDLPALEPPETQDRPPTATPIPAATARPSPAPTVEIPSPTSVGQPPELVSTSTPIPTVSPTTTATPTTTSTITGTATVTATTTVTATATSEPTETGILEIDEIFVDKLSAGGKAIWLLQAAANDELTISVGPSLSLDVKLNLIGPDGALIATRDVAGAGEGETLKDVSIPTSGTYEVHINAVGTTSGQYGLVYSEFLSEPILVFQSALIYGNNGSGTLPQNTDHLWGVEGQMGDVITVIVQGDSDKDIILYLIGPDGSELENVNEGGTGENEELVSFVLPETGFYFIAIGEVDFEPMSYNFSLTSGS